MNKPNKKSLANNISNHENADVFIYNGSIERDFFVQFFECINKHKNKDNCILILVTRGGDPDAGYKFCRLLQDYYSKVTLFVTGQCKSAGTLIAAGANAVKFGPLGELGPIDIQTYETDNLAQRQSGLTISVAMDTLAHKAIQMHGATFASILNDTGSVVSFHSAAKVASDLIVGLFSPVFSQIDPIDVGDKARAMRIATSYGDRLATRGKNVKPRVYKNGNRLTVAAFGAGQTALV